MPCLPRKIRLLDYCVASSQCTLVRAAKHANGVPVYVFYRPGKPPVVLTEVLSVDEVRSTIAQL